MDYNNKLFQHFIPFDRPVAGGFSFLAQEALYFVCYLTGDGGIAYPRKVNPQIYFQPLTGFSFPNLPAASNIYVETCGSMIGFVVATRHPFPPVLRFYQVEIE